MAEDYKVVINDVVTVYGKELTVKQKVKLKEAAQTAFPLDRMTIDDEHHRVRFKPVAMATLDVHNEHVKEGDTDYSVTVVLADTGEAFRTGSPSCKKALEACFENIAEIIQEAPTEAEADDWLIEVYRMPSKNRQGKEFLTARVI